MRCLLALLLLTACSESHLIGEFDSGPARVDAGGFDAPSFDVPSFDAVRFDVSRSDVPPRRDASARDAGPMRVDVGPIFDGGPDTSGPFDIPAECIQLCERAEMCIEGTELGECVGGCIDIQEFVDGPTCELLAYNIFRCADDVPCAELERTFDDGACQGAIQEFGESCGVL